MRLIVVVLTVLGLSAAALDSARAETAIGAAFGYPGNVGLSLRFDRVPINVAWSSDFVHGTIDTWLKKTPMKDGDGKMAWYYGIGADAGIPLDDSEDFFLAGRVPFGLQFMATPKLELFGELAPGIQFVSDVDFYWAGTAGVRFLLGGKK
jgi:hypothetical protein